MRSQIQARTRKHMKCRAFMLYSIRHFENNLCLRDLFSFAVCALTGVCKCDFFGICKQKGLKTTHSNGNVCRCVSWSITPSFDYIHTDFVWWICLFATFMFQSSELMIFICAFLCLRCGQNSHRTYSTKESNRQNNNKMIIKTDFFEYKRGESLH